MVTSDKVHIAAPYKLSEEEIVAIQNRLPETKGKVFEQSINPQLMGGFILQIGSRRIDLSLKSELQKLRTLLYETA